MLTLWGLKASLTDVEMKRYPDHLGFALMDAEQKMLLQKRRVAKAVMARACWSLPSPTSVEREQFEASVSRFHEFIQVNELGLAFEQLCAAAELVDCQGSVWRDLERAAQVMGLHDKVPYLRERFRAAPIQGVRGDRRRGNASGGE